MKLGDPPPTEATWWGNQGAESFRRGVGGAPQPYHHSASVRAKVDF